jgi:hypothetical protein
VLEPGCDEVINHDCRGPLEAYNSAQGASTRNLMRTFSRLRTTSWPWRGRQSRKRLRPWERT